MAEVAPTILATTLEDYTARVERVKGFADRIHIDISDGIFTNNRTIGLGDAFLVDGAVCDLHLMIDEPEEQLESVIALRPSLAIIHDEAKGDLAGCFSRLREAGIRVGLAVLPQTPIDAIKHHLSEIDHLLIFTGTLGHNGGQFSLDCLEKVAQAREINPQLEIAVDGGVNNLSGQAAVAAGVNLLDCGSYIQDAPNPEAAYRSLKTLVGVGL
jgi:ribulose-phosphate 3-epimerase